MLDFLNKEKQSKTQDIFQKMDEVESILKAPVLTPENKEKIKEKLKKITEATIALDHKKESFFQHSTYEKLKKIFPDHEFFKNNIEFINNVQLIPDANVAHNLIEQAIDKATTSIDMTVFVWKNDAVGNRLLQKLYIKAKSSPKLVITIKKELLGASLEGDDTLLHNTTFQNTQHPLLAQLLKLPNIREYNTSIGNDASNFIIIDKKDAYLGNVGLTQEGLVSKPKDYLDHIMEYYSAGKKMIGGDTNSSTAFRSYMIAVKNSPIFVDRLLQKTNIYSKNIPTASHSSSIDVIVNNNQTKGNILEKNNEGMEIKQKIIDIINSAKQTIHVEIESIGDPAIISALQKAIKAGRTVDLILPQKARVGQHTNMKTAGDLLTFAKKNNRNNSFHIHLYPQSIQNTALCVDKNTLFLGSANYDNNSLTLLNETNILITSPEAPSIKIFEDQFRQDKTNSYLLTSVPSYNKGMVIIESGNQEEIMDPKNDAAIVTAQDAYLERMLSEGNVLGALTSVFEAFSELGSNHFIDPNTLLRIAKLMIPSFSVIPNPKVKNKILDTLHSKLRASYDLCRTALQEFSNKPTGEHIVNSGIHTVRGAVDGLVFIKNFFTLDTQTYANISKSAPVIENLLHTKNSSQSASCMKAFFNMIGPMHINKPLFYKNMSITGIVMVLGCIFIPGKITSALQTLSKTAKITKVTGTFITAVDKISKIKPTKTLEKIALSAGKGGEKFTIPVKTEQHLRQNPIVSASDWEKMKKNSLDAIEKESLSEVDKTRKQLKNTAQNKIQKTTSYIDGQSEKIEALTTKNAFIKKYTTKPLNKTKDAIKKQITSGTEKLNSSIDEGSNKIKKVIAKESNEMKHKYTK